MTDNQKVVSVHNDGRRVLLYLSVAAALGVVLWTVVKTELRVRDLVSRGFTDVAIDSARNHAYAPLIGSLVGAGIMIGLVVLLKRKVRK